MKFHPDSLRAKREFKLQACDVEHKLTLVPLKMGETIEVCFILFT